MSKATLDDLLVAGRGKTYQGYISMICPFHQSFPVRASLLAWKDGWFRCTSCGKNGHNDYLLEVLRGRPARISEEVYTDWKPPLLPTDPAEIDYFCGKANEAILDNPSLGWYYEMRGVSNLIESACLGWYNGWATIPIRSYEGLTKGVILRAGPHVEQASAGTRFHQPKGQKGMMYCPDWGLLERSENVAVVFGIFDALAMASIHVPVVTPTAGKDSFQPRWLDSVWRGHAYIVPDRKEEATAYKLSKALSLYGVFNTVLLLEYPNGCKDPADHLSKGHRKTLEKTMHSFLS